MLNVMKELIEKLTQADVAYYKYDAPIMSDREYDELFDKLTTLEAETGIILSGSPTQKVSGEILEELTPVRHTKPMLSAKKTKANSDIVKFVDGKAVIISWKLDGLTLVLRYEYGRLVQAITRGVDGMIGEDVTHTVKTMKNVPLIVPRTEPFEVRGEGVSSWSNFERVNQNIDVDDEPYTHPRGLAAGNIRRLDAGKCKNKELEFFAFELIEGDADFNKQDQLEMLAENGFDTAPYLLLPASSSIQQIEAAINSFDPKVFDYPVDGRIIEYDDVTFGKSLGATGHHENRLIALKWEDKLYETTFLGLELATTRTGMISLTGKFADIKIDGTTVNRAYLHNLDILDSFSLGVGDKVKIYKANMIIPQLGENITRSGTLGYPTECPCCGTVPIIKTSPKGTRMIFCDNPSCPAKLIRKFVHFCHKTRMNIPGLSEKTLEKFVSNGWVKTFGDLYELEQHRSEIVNMPNFGVNMFDKIQQAIENSRYCTLNQLISGLGIHTIGRSASRTLNSYFHGDWNAFEQAIKDGFDFSQLEDFGPTMNANIYAWYADTEAERFWKPLLQHVKIKKIEKENVTMNTNNPFYGKIVAATGKLENYTRDGIQDKLLSLGAKPGSSISKNTDFLIVGESAGSKLAKAQTLGVKTLSESEFEAMLTGEQSGQSNEIAGAMLRSMFGGKL